MVRTLFGTKTLGLSGSEKDRLFSDSASRVVSFMRGRHDFPGCLGELWDTVGTNDVTTLTIIVQI